MYVAKLLTSLFSRELLEKKTLELLDILQSMNYQEF